MDQPIDMLYMYFRYHPNKPTAYVALAVFVLIDIYVISRIKLQNAPAFMYKLIAFVTMETLGFILRIVCFSTDINLPKFLLMNLFMIIAPNIVILVNYNSITHMIRLSNLTNESKLNAKKLKIITIFCTIIPSMLQGIGGALQTVADLRTTGLKVAMAGASIQLFVFVVFFSCLTYIARNKSINYRVEGVKNPKKMVLIRAYGGLFLLAIRTIYRLIQFATGPTGYITNHEWTLYVFDSLIAASVFLIFSTYNSCFPKNGEEGFEEIDEEKCEKSRNMNGSDTTLEEIQYDCKQ